MLKSTKTLILVGFMVALLMPVTVAAADKETRFISRFGAGDTLGALNFLSSDRVLAAMRLVRKGDVYQLGMVTGPNTPAYGTRKFQLIVHQLADGSGTPVGSNELVGNDDTLITSIGIGSQIDGLGHIGHKHRYYNNRPAAEVVAPDGLKTFGTHTLPGIVTRGVLLDMVRYFGDNPVPSGTAFTEQDIKRAAKRQGVTIGEGDVVLFHTGYMQANAGNPKLVPTEPGLGVSGADYLAKLGVVAIGADTWAVEALPSENPNEVFPVHMMLLAKYGVYILENMVTEKLAADRVGAFAFVLGVPKIQGTVQAIINPLAIR